MSCLSLLSIGFQVFERAVWVGLFLAARVRQCLFFEGRQFLHEIIPIVQKGLEPENV